MSAVSRVTIGGWRQETDDALSRVTTGGWRQEVTGTTGGGTVDGAGTSTAVATVASVGKSLFIAVGTSSGSASISGVGLATIIIRPFNDASVGDWVPSSGVSLHPMISEVIYDDATYISTSVASTYEVMLGVVADPSSSSNHTINFRAKNDGSLGLEVKLYQGSTTLISSYTPTLTSSYQNFSWTLTSGEADSITDYSNLRIKFVAV